MAWMWKSSSEKRPGNKADFWKQSAASFQLRESRKENERKKPNDAARREISPYQERRRLENSYGRVAFLSDGEGRIGVEMARNSFLGPEDRREGRKRLNTEKSVRFSMEGGRGYAEGSMPEKSAFRWTESAELPGKRIMNELRRLSVSFSQQTMREMMPEAEKEVQVHGHTPYFRRLEEGLEKTLDESRRDKVSREKKQSELWLLQSRLFNSERKKEEESSDGSGAEEEQQEYPDQNEAAE